MKFFFVLFEWTDFDVIAVVGIAVARSCMHTILGYGMEFV